MDTTGSPRSLYCRLTPKKSPATEHVQKRRKELERSERAAYWALFNTSIALLLYYDLCYLKFLNSISYLEWIACALFAISACYDFTLHFWPHTFMKPVIVNQVERRLLGIQEDEFGFKIEESIPVKFEPVELPPFEIHHFFEEDVKVEEK